MADLLADRPDRRRRLRRLLTGGAPVLAPGAYDALSARLVEAAGFPAVYMTGFGTTASLLGRPDVGLLGGAEMIDNARRIAAAVDLPLIADADTGYGNPINVVRTVREYEQAGVAGIHLEDQVLPKRCGHMTGKSVIDPADMVAKVRAAVAARTDPDFLLIARTDARAVEGLDAALARARAYADAGADALFVEAPVSEDEVTAVAKELGDVPLVFNWAEGARTPPVSLSTLAELGFALVIFPLSTMLAATAGIRSVLETLRVEGTPQSMLAGLPGFDEFLDFIGLPEIERLGRRFDDATS